MDTILCDELLEEVFHRLPPRSSSSTTTTTAAAAADISLVSKRWLRLYRSSKSTLSLHLSPDNSTPLSVSSFLSHFPYLSSLSLSTPAPSDAVSTFSDNLLLSAASSCPKLRILRLHSGPISFLPLLSLSTSCPHLTSPHLSLHLPIQTPLFPLPSLLPLSQNPRPLFPLPPYRI